MKKFLIIFLSAFSILINAQSDPNLKWLHPSTTKICFKVGENVGCQQLVSMR